MMSFALPQARNGAWVPWTSRHMSHRKETVNHNKSFLISYFFRFLSYLHPKEPPQYLWWQHYYSYLNNNSDMHAIPLLCVNRTVYGVNHILICQDLDLSGTVREWRTTRQGDTQNTHTQKQKSGNTELLMEKPQKPRGILVYYRIEQGSGLLHTIVQRGQITK